MTGASAGVSASTGRRSWPSSTGSRRNLQTWIISCTIWKNDSREKGRGPGSLEKPYTPADLDYNNKSARVYKEHDDPSLRNVALKNAKPANWQDYDTVFVGYPIWWGIAAWPMDTFVKSNDFTGKTVIPFATAYSSGLGSSADQLKEMVGSKGTWLQGRCFTGTIQESQVKDWVKSLGVK